MNQRSIPDAPRPVSTPAADSLGTRIGRLNASGASISFAERKAAVTRGR
jgi:hypothetical protein